MAENPVTRPKVRKEDGGGMTAGPDPGSTSGPYDHPVYKKLAQMNGEINKMSKEQIKDRLADLKLDTRGVKEVLKKRLKNHYKRLKLNNANVRKNNDKEPHYDYYLVIDFEATCEEYNLNYKHEIIEFPIILVDAKEKTAIDEFHSYVCPVINKQLTEFCTTLTGISQSQVNKSPSFHNVLEKVTEWMEKHKLGTEKTFAVVTDGPWDMGRFMYQQCQHSTIRFPHWARKWLNIRKAYRNFYRYKKNHLKLHEMLESLGMTFQGHQHSGIDDSRNIARVLIRMLVDGASMKVNEELYSYKIRNNPDAGTAEMKVGEVNAEDDTQSSESEDDSEESTGKSTECSSSTVKSDNTHCPGSTNRLHCNNNKLGVVSNDHDESNDLHSKLKALSVNEIKQQGSPECGSDSEQYDDLLAYYALQKV